MKRMVLFTLFITFFISGFSQQVLQGNWRMRSDTKITFASTWLAPENNAPELYNYENVRLRIELFNEGLINLPVSLLLEDSCEETGKWVKVSANSEVGAFMLAGFSEAGKDGKETTRQLSGMSDLPFIKGREVISEEQPLFILPAKTKTEMEWVIKPTASFFNSTNHYLRVSGIGYPSPVILVTANSTLPVQISAFNAMQHGHRVKILWTTATEHNNDHFEILRSNDGRNNWKVIATQNGYGNTTQPHDYLVYDYNPQSGNNYYRIKQFDLDGRSNETGKNGFNEYG